MNLENSDLFPMRSLSSPRLRLIAQTGAATTDRLSVAQRRSRHAHWSVSSDSWLPTLHIVPPASRSQLPKPPWPGGPLQFRIVAPQHMCQTAASTAANELERVERCATPDSMRVSRGTNGAPRVHAEHHSCRG
jgi:hypothetical protein